MQLKTYLSERKNKAKLRANICEKRRIQKDYVMPKELENYAKRIT